MAYIFEKGRFTEPRGYLAEIRDAEKHDSKEMPPCKGVEDNFAAAFRECLVKLVPEIEKK